MKASSRHFNKIIIAVAVLLLININLFAAARLPGYFTDNMVLQRDISVPIWGWANANEEITVEFAGQKFSTKADAKGKWMVRLKKMKANATAQVLIVNQIQLKNILVGDVWICSGQSNMEWHLNGATDSKKEIADASYPQIRHIKVNHISHDIPQENAKSYWQVCSPQTAGGFTAVGYFFGRRLHKELNVPIGLIGSNWGGTRVEPWTPPIGFAMVPQLQGITTRINNADPSTTIGKKAYETKITEIEAWVSEAKGDIAVGKRPRNAPTLPAIGTSHQDPTRLYNAMIHPLIPYAIRGAIWYQGESNGQEGESYFHKKTALIQGWRKLWDQGDFPFYFVQLANFQNPTTDPAGGNGWAKVREAQRKTLTLKNTGMAVIIDVGEARDIHPKNKQDVGSRLAQWALAEEYGKKIVKSGPLYKSMKVDGNKVLVSFDCVGKGLMAAKKTGLTPPVEQPNTDLLHFAVAGADKQWHWAKATIDGDTVVLFSDNVLEPVAVRYAFRMNPGGVNFYNKDGLPASPFRTDNW